jgi:hypothetical protein
MTSELDLVISYYIVHNTNKSLSCLISAHKNAIHMTTR